jgi:hypothetical protein
MMDNKEGQMKPKWRISPVVYFILTIVVAYSSLVAASAGITFPNGSATSSETCGECHKEIYLEYTMGVGGDNRSEHTMMRAMSGDAAWVPARVSSSASALGRAYQRRWRRKERLLQQLPFPETFCHRQDGER